MAMKQTKTSWFNVSKVTVSKDGKSIVIIFEDAVKHCGVALPIAYLNKVIANKNDKNGTN